MAIVKTPKMHRWARNITKWARNVNHRLPFVVCRLRKTNFRFRLQQRNGSWCFPLDMCILKWQHMYVYLYILYIYTHTENGTILYICRCFKWKTEAQAILLNPFTVCTSCKRMFVGCLLVDEETNRSCPFAKGLDRLYALNRLAHLCKIVLRPIAMIGLCHFYFTLCLKLSVFKWFIMKSVYYEFFKKHVVFSGV